MISNKIHNLIFDLGCVIVDLDRQKCIEALERIGAGEIAHYVDECKQIDMFLDLELGKIDVAEFCREIRKRAPGCKASDEEISRAWGELLTGIPVERLQMIERLHRKYNIYLLSNSNPVHWDKSVDNFFPKAGHEPEYYFDKMFISYKMGMVKPDPRIFETLIRETGIIPEETLFIDDSTANCRAAEEFGINTLHVTHGSEWLEEFSGGSESYEGSGSSKSSEGSKSSGSSEGSGSSEFSEKIVATIGFFDGVHRGHRYLIDQVKAVAREHGAESMVITFDRHPREVLHSDYQPQMLSTLSEKTEMIKATGVDHCEVLPFDEAMALLSAYDFMKTVLRERLGVKYLVIGYDNRFGHNRSEGFDDYVRFGRELGIEVIRAKAFVLNGVNVSSSVVRSFLSAGEVEMAAMCLGYRYSISGKVVSGVQEGRKMGFPTANIDIKGIKKMLPANGVYAVVALLSDGSQYQAMMNIGMRPTFHGEKTTLEVNLFDFSGDLYGKQLSVSFVKRIREERKFESEKALKRQLEKDREECLKIEKWKD